MVLLCQGSISSVQILHIVDQGVLVWVQVASIHRKYNGEVAHEVSLDIRE